MQPDALSTSEGSQPSRACASWACVGNDDCRRRSSTALVLTPSTWPNMWLSAADEQPGDATTSMTLNARRSPSARSDAEPSIGSYREIAEPDRVQARLEGRRTGGEQFVARLEGEAPCLRVDAM